MLVFRMGEVVLPSKRKETKRWVRSGMLCTLCTCFHGSKLRSVSSSSSSGLSPVVHWTNGFANRCKGIEEHIRNENILRTNSIHFAYDEHSFLLVNFDCDTRLFVNSRRDIGYTHASFILSSSSYMPVLSMPSFAKLR